MSAAVPARPGQTGAIHQPGVKQRNSSDFINDLLVRSSDSTLGQEKIKSFILNNLFYPQLQLQTLLLQLHTQFAPLLVFVTSTVAVLVLVIWQNNASKSVRTGQPTYFFLKVGQAQVVHYRGFYSLPGHCRYWC